VWAMDFDEVEKVGARFPIVVDVVDVDAHEGCLVAGRPVVSRDSEL
jgi:hypothetical protein